MTPARSASGQRPATGGTAPGGKGSAYPGEGLGRPASGPGSLARVPRRVVAFVLDWYLCWAGVWALAGVPSGWGSLVVVGVFFLYQCLLVGLLGHTLGQWLLGMQVQTLWGQPAGLGRAALRSLLVVLFLPVVVTDEDSRGYQDRAAGTVLVRIR